MSRFRRDFAWQQVPLQTVARVPSSFEVALKVVSFKVTLNVDEFGYETTNPCEYGIYKYH